MSNLFDKTNEDIINSIDNMMDYQQGERIIILLEQILKEVRK